MAWLLGIIGEHPAAFGAGFTIAESNYAEFMATLEVARTGGAHELTSALRGGLDRFFEVVPPTLFFAHGGIPEVDTYHPNLSGRRARARREFQAVEPRSRSLEAF